MMKDVRKAFRFLAPRLRAAPLFAFLLAAQSVCEFTVLQLKGECFAPPRPWFVQLH